MTQNRRSHLPFLFASMLWIALSPIPGVRGDEAQYLARARPAGPRVLDRMVARNAERADALERYRGRRTYQIDYTGFPKNMHAEMVVEMTFQAPATKTFTVVSQSGSQLLINRVLKRLLETEQEATTGDNPKRTALTPDNYNFTLLEDQNSDESCPYVFAVEPKVPTKLLYRGRIWVNAKDFAVCRVEAEPAKNPDFLIKKTEIHHTYQKVGDFWLPSENQSISTIRLNGRAVLTIKYEDYEILAARAVKESETKDPH